MSNNDQHDDGWVACPSGTLRQVADQIRADGISKSRHGYSRGVIFGLMLAVVAFGVVAVRNQSSSTSAELTCNEVMTLMADYAAGQLDQEDADRVLAHLAHCDKCRQAFESAYPDYDLGLARSGALTESYNRVAFDQVRVRQTDANNGHYETVRDRRQTDSTLLAMASAR